MPAIQEESLLSHFLLCIATHIAALHETNRAEQNFYLYSIKV